MATRSTIVCPVCQESMDHDQRLVDHLTEQHEKRKLAKHLVAETELREGFDISE